MNIKDIKVGDHVDLRLKVREFSTVDWPGGFWMDWPNGDRGYVLVTPDHFGDIVNHIPAPPPKPQLGDTVVYGAGSNEGKVMAIDEANNVAWVKWLSNNYGTISLNHLNVKR